LTKSFVHININLLALNKTKQKIMYTDKNFKTKKAVKEAIAAGQIITVFQPNDIFGNPAARPDYTGKVNIEGPHYPAPHSWYATGHVVNGKLVKVS
jgi:hypothetical protein